MAILKNETLDGRGVEKRINSNAKDLILKTLQSNQYRYPIKSFIRETASNCVDSIVEKNNARKILKGEATVEDFYVASDGSDIQSDSKFNASYYDLERLNPEDEINISYINRDWSNRDLIRIQDTGVGLGGSRLQGFFDLG